MPKLFQQLSQHQFIQGSKQDHHGFSLVEMVIVIVIIAILSGLAMLRFVDLFDKTADAGCAATTARVNSAISVLVAKDRGQSSTVADLATAGFRVQPTVTGGSLDFGNNCVVRTYASGDCRDPANNSRDDSVLCVQQASSDRDGNMGRPSPQRPPKRRPW